MSAAIVGVHGGTKPAESTMTTGHVSKCEMELAAPKQRNNADVQRVNDIVLLALGGAAGVLRLELVYGFALYVVGMAAVCFILPLRSPSLQTSTVIHNIPGFLMTWCFMFALIS